MLEVNRSRTRPSALQHGAWSETAVLPGEDPRQFNRLHHGLVDEWSPSGPAEEDAVFTLAKCMWPETCAREYLRCPSASG